LNGRSRFLSNGDENGKQEPSPIMRPLFFQKKVDTTASSSFVKELGSARQSLVIVASAVDKIPNLAGLARTCEVFRARTLVVNDASIVTDGEFKSISRTAENWMPIVECKVASVPEYLIRLRRDEGFVLLGLEQTTSSIPLQDMEWPSHGRVCIVLGAEGTGVPPEILALLDMTIEIPQFGLVKSLNVHVSGAVCIWAYTQAMLAYGI
jgi:tRNA guanosine-2'-O-methyltransferase